MIRNTTVTAQKAIYGLERVILVFDASVRRKGSDVTVVMSSLTKAFVSDQHLDI